LNIEPLWLICDFIPLPFDGNDSLDYSRLILCGSWSFGLLKIALTSLATLAILPLPFLDVVSVNGPSFIPLFLGMSFHLRLFYRVPF
jgi:hypothetical protein